MLLLDVLALASDQRILSRQTEATAAPDLAELVAKQRELEGTCAKTLSTDPPHPMLMAAHQQLGTAASALQSSDRANARRSQEAADDTLRHFIIEQALILETAVGRSSPERRPSPERGRN